MVRQSPRRSPTYYHYLLTETVGDEQAVLVGGQAVNLWALVFLNDEPELKKCRPFTSKDCDVVASTEWTRKIADQYRLNYRTFRAGQASPAVGVISIPLSKNEATEERCCGMLLA